MKRQRLSAECGLFLRQPTARKRTHPPYGMSDSVTNFATVSLDELLAAMA
jgi:hypothetical protein